MKRIRKNSLFITLLFALLVYSCVSSRKNTFPPSGKEFYYDEPNFLLIKLNPEKSKNLLMDYLNWSSVDSNNAFAFYKEKVLNVKELNPELTKDDYKNIIKPKMIKRPNVDYPMTAPIVGGFLTVVITVTIDTNGYVEFAKLYNIYRDAKTNSEKDKELIKTGIDPWTRNRIDNYDKPFIKLSLIESLKLEFMPATVYSKPIRVTMRVPYQYIVGSEYDKR